MKTLSSQVYIPGLPESASQAWVAFLRAHAATRREMGRRLKLEQGLSLSDYEVLLRLSQAPERSLKRVDLSHHLLLTPSGVTRLLEGLECQGYVAKASCATDARVTYAVLTPAGDQKLREAAKTHVVDIKGLFAERFTLEELETLGQLLGRLADGEAPACTPPE
jgi:DNA-binding MarR family transcriptional regulator